MKFDHVVVWKEEVVPDHVGHHARGDIERHQLHLVDVSFGYKIPHFLNVCTDILQEQCKNVDVEADSEGKHSEERNLCITHVISVILLLVIYDSFERQSRAAVEAVSDNKD